MAALRLAFACRAGLRPALAAAPIQRAIATSAVRMKSELPLPDDMEHAVGIEKFEKMAELAGVDDPWDLKLAETGDGTRENPTLVTSIYNKRLVGHICEEEANHITYFYVQKNEPKRCKCGHWFSCVDAEPYHY